MKGLIIWNEIKNFTENEFDCHCGCGLNNINTDLVYKLDEARELAGVAFKINSACRCEKRNTSEGGEKLSSHLDGLAVDIKVLGSAHRFLILKSLLAVGFTRIGVYETFIHCDIDKTKPQNVVWYK